MVACFDRRIVRAILFVSRDLTHRASLTEAANAAGLQPNYFARRFRQTTGSSFGKWSGRARVAEAKRLLRCLDMPVISVALSVGYDDTTTFARLFRRHEGMCPRQYRRTLRKSSFESPNSS